MNLSSTESLRNHESPSTVNNQPAGATISNLLNKPNPKVNINRTLNCYCEAMNFYDISDLMEAFTGKGSLIEYKPYIEGFETLHVLRKEYSITFKADDPETGKSSKLPLFHELFKEGCTATNDKGVNFSLRTVIPNPVTTLVTMYPVPIEVTNQIIMSIIFNNKWGVCSRVVRGVYDAHPEWKNGYVHICLENIQKSNIPPFIMIGNKRVYTSVQDEFTVDLNSSITSIEHAEAKRRSRSRKKLKKKPPQASDVTRMNIDRARSSSPNPHSSPDSAN